MKIGAKSKIRVSEKLRKDLFEILDYLWRDEKRHYCEGRSKDHIYLIVKRVANEINFRPSIDW